MQRNKHNNLVKHASRQDLPSFPQLRYGQNMWNKYFQETRNEVMKDHESQRHGKGMSFSPAAAYCLVSLQVGHTVRETRWRVFNSAIRRWSWKSRETTVSTVNTSETCREKILEVCRGSISGSSWRPKKRVRGNSTCPVISPWWGFALDKPKKSFKYKTQGQALIWPSS